MRTSVIIIVGLLLGALPSGAQEVSIITFPTAFDIALGTRLVYTPYNKLEMHGYHFSAKRVWSTETYVSGKTSVFDLTYTSSPAGISTAVGAVLFSQSHRVDAELKTNWVVNPTLTTEWSILDIHSGKWVEVELPPRRFGGAPEKGAVLVQQRDTIQRLYGGLGISYERLIAPTVLAKNTLAWRFINCDGWEASSSLSWVPRKTTRGEPHITIGVVGHGSTYDWGMSQNCGFRAELGFKF